MRSSEASLTTGLLLTAGVLVGCAAEQPSTHSEAPAHAAVPSAGPAEARPGARPAPRAARPDFVVSDGQPRRATVSIPRIALQDLIVRPYRGFTDDQPGTEIQNRGLAASPHGPRGGVGPGGVGNFQVTAHRTSSTRAFERLPVLRPGNRVFVESRGVEYVYEIVRTRQTSFRSAASLRAQRAPVPGDPGREPTEAMITLSTCTTPEDHAVGNYWSDRFGNPEHRIDKIGRLVRSRPVE